MKLCMWARYDKSADLSRCVLNRLYLRSKTPPYPPPLRSPRTDFVSLGKTRRSRADVLIPATLRVGVGGSPRGGAILLFDKTSVFNAGVIPRWAPKRARLIATRPIRHKQKCAERTLYVGSKRCTANSQKARLAQTDICQTDLVCIRRPKSVRVDCSLFEIKDCPA